jgi:hypothetical protein
MSIRLALAAALLFPLSMSFPATAADFRAAPQPGCLDARAIQNLHALGAERLAVASSDGRRFRLEVAPGCLGDLSQQTELSLLAPQAWICGGENEFLRNATTARTCALGAVTEIDSREFAALVRNSAHGELPTVAVHGRKRQGFAAGHDYCFASRNARAFTPDAEGVVVAVNARRSGGNQRYRVVLDGACPDLEHWDGLGFISAARNGLICGTAGDAVVAVRDQNRLPVETSLHFRDRCAIREVYPLPG